MDAGSSSPSSSSSSSWSSLRKSISRFPPQEQQILRRRTSRENLDRFIPDRSAMDFDYAHHMLTEGRKKGKENSTAVISPSSEAYQKLLAETLNMNRTRILAFKNKPPAPVEAFPGDFATANSSSKPRKPCRCIPKTSERVLCARDISNDYCLNLLDWGSSNVLSIALENRVYLWDASDGTVSKVVRVDEDIGPVTSIKWAPDGRCLAIGLNNSDVLLWDSMADRLLGTLKGGHQARVGSLDWNNHTILTTGGMDGRIINHDVRVRAHIVQTYRGHHQEVCGLKWSASGQQLASGGIDNLLHIWDRSMASTNARTRWLHRLEDTAAVKALAWCPFQGKLLASGGGEGGRCIKFWNTHTGACLNFVDTGSQVCALLWNKNEHELLSSHGFTQNHLSLWKYPSMVKRAELTGHTSRVLFMAQSPNGRTVASAAADETVRFWNVFGTPGATKPSPKTNAEPFANLNRIR